jgi:uncharacterized protein (DUF362 family)/NAD-dependent dihydropyrimidine dehydrogenase PreA subunit
LTNKGNAITLGPIILEGKNSVDKAQVAVVRCPTYDEASVEAAVKRGVDLLGGMQRFAQSGEKILLKPNLLVGAAPEKSINPHPFVFKAVGRMVKDISSRVSYGDSPGFGRPGGQARRAQLDQCAQALGIPLADFENGREVHFTASPFIKRFTLANGVLEADGLISIGKFKTHQLTRITGAVKNQLGCVPGMLKAEFHVKLPDPHDFGKMLVCLNLYIRPRLYIVDGITAMEGNGPRNGSPVQMRVLLFSTDPIALDATLCRLIDLNPEHVPTHPPGREWGLGTYRSQEIEWLGDPLPDLVNKKFKAVRAPVKSVTAPSGAVATFKNLVSPRPVIAAAKCGRCGVCVNVCPVNPKAVNWQNGDKTKPPAHHYDRCIRCFCCQELCPESAIGVETPLLGRLLRR